MRLKNQHLLIDKKGQLSNGTIICDGCTIEAGAQLIFNNVSLSGDWSKNYGYLEWFQGSHFEDAQKNFKTLNALLEVGFKIYLTTMVPLETVRNTAVSHPSRNVHIKGNHRVKSGLTLVTKHKNQFYNYFQSDKGCNLYLENLTLQSEDFSKGVFSEKTPEYFFTGSYYQSQFNPGAQPDIDSIIVKNCTIKGNITLANYGSHSSNQSKQDFWSHNKIKKMSVSGSDFFNSNGTFSFANMAYGDILIENNHVYDFTGPLLSIPESGLDESYYEGLRKNKGKIIIQNNTFKNSKPVHVPSGRALTPCVVKGGQGIMEFNNNVLEDLLGLNGDGDVNTFYYTSSKPGYFSAKNNIIKNVVGRGSGEYPASLVKHRWSTVFYLEDNRITIDKEALVRIGVLKNINEPLSKIDGHNFNLTFMQIGGQTDFTKEMTIRNNYFSVPYVNRSTEIFDAARFIFENNTLNIDYFGPAKVASTVSEDHTFFLGRQRLDLPEGQKADKFSSVNNTITIGQTGEGLFRYVHFPQGVQVGNPQMPDVKFNYETVVFNDVFNVNQTHVQMDILDTKTQSVTSWVHGRGNSFSLFDMANVNHTRSSAGKLMTSIVIDDADWKDDDHSPFVFIPGSDQKVRVKNHKGKTINLLNYIYFISLYNLSNDENLIVEIDFKGKDRKNKTLSERYYLYLNQKGRTFLYENEKGTFVEVSPGENYGRKDYVRSNRGASSSPKEAIQLMLENGNKHLKDALIYLDNCDQVKEYEIVCRMFSSGRTKPTQQQFQQQVGKLSQQANSSK